MCVCHHWTSLLPEPQASRCLVRPVPLVGLADEAHPFQYLHRHTSHQHCHRCALLWSHHDTMQSELDTSLLQKSQQYAVSLLQHHATMFAPPSIWRHLLAVPLLWATLVPPLCFSKHDSDKRTEWSLLLKPASHQWFGSRTAHRSSFEAPSLPCHHRHTRSCSAHCRPTHSLSHHHMCVCHHWTSLLPEPQASRCLVRPVPLVGLADEAHPFQYLHRHTSHQHCHRCALLWSHHDTMQSELDTSLLQKSQQYAVSLFRLLVDCAAVPWEWPLDGWHVVFLMLPV